MIKKNNLISWQFFMGFVLSISCLIYTLKDFKFTEFIYMLRNINLLSIIIATILLIISVYLRSLRWKFMVSEDRISIKDLFTGQFIGYFGNNVLPLRLGELLKSRFIAKRYNLTTSKIFGTVILERSFDILGIIFLAIVLLFINYNLLIEYKYTFYIIPLSLIMIIIILYSLLTKTRNYAGTNKFFLVIINLINGIKSLNKNNLFFIIFYTVLIWTIYILHLYLVQDSINLGLDISECVFLLFVSSIVLSIPSLPANIGTFEAGVKETLLMLNISSYQSSFPFLLHSLTFVPYVLIGGILFMYYNYQVFHNK